MTNGPAPTDPAISPQLLQRVIELFTELGWTITSELEGDAEVFQNFCEMLSLLTDAERDLVLDLSRDFLRCSLTHYDLYVSRLVKQLVQLITQPTQLIIAVPLLKPEDLGKIKSGGFALYLFRTAFEVIAKDKGWRFFSYADPDLLATEHPTRDNAVILLLDDFLGTGDTAESAIDHYRSNLAVPTDTPLVLSVVAQRRALDVIARLGVGCLTPIVRERGISDSPRFADKSKALGIMDGIERQLKVGRDYLRGYGESEALVCMRRCPNNTFPLYWTTKPFRGKPWPAPFAR